MKTLRVGAAALNQTPLDWQGNQGRIIDAIDQAAERGVNVLVLPELAITGYGCEDMFLAPGITDRAERVLESIVPLTKQLVVAVGLPLVVQNQVFNGVAVCVDGRLVGVAMKQHLAGDGLHYEPRWFKPWPQGIKQTIKLAGTTVDVGDIFIDVDGLRIGFEICEDAWVANRPGTALAQVGLDLLLNPSASHFAFGKDVIRRRFVEEGSRALGVAYVYSNLLGNEAGRIIYDGDCLIATEGKLVAAGKPLGFSPVQLTVADIDVEQNRRIQRERVSVVPVFDDPRCVVVDPGDFLIDGGPDRVVADVEPVLIKEEAFTRAVALGLFDYMRKARAKGFILSLSGGADSAAVAMLIAIMAEEVIKELGPSQLYNALGIALDTDEDLMPRLLTCVYQATENSGDVTLNAAQGLAEAIGATFINWDVDPLVAGYRALAEDAVGRGLSWDQDDLALQNIQARVRAPGVWMLANIKQALLLATSNRSEAAVGYATMDGDTCGGLSPLAGIDKAFLLDWLRWLKTDGGVFGSRSYLEIITRQAPTAELRPQEAGQTDEDDLMPYAILDAVERLAIGKRMMPDDIQQAIVRDFDVEPDKAAEWIRAFYQRWTQNQWKRERYAPAFHLDDESLDPKTWCRFPILNGGLGAFY